MIVGCLTRFSESSLPRLLVYALSSPFALGMVTPQVLVPPPLFPFCLPTVVPTFLVFFPSFLWILSFWLVVSYSLFWEAALCLSYCHFEPNARLEHFMSDTSLTDPDPPRFPKRYVFPRNPKKYPPVPGDSCC